MSLTLKPRCVGAYFCTHLAHALFIVGHSLLSFHSLFFLLLCSLRCLYYCSLSVFTLQYADSLSQKAALAAARNAGAKN